MIWAEDWPSWILAMSAIGGSSVHPEVVVRRVMSTGAPQFGQLDSAPADSVRQYGQLIGGGGDLGHCPFRPSRGCWYMDWMPTRPGPGGA